MNLLHDKVCRNRFAWIVLLGLSAGVGGCSVGEAVIDGFYGGISDTVAGVIAELLLGGG